MAQHTNHESEHDHLVAASLTQVYDANGDEDTQSWFCEGCADDGRYGTLVKRTWIGTHWTPWYTP